jgi:soluble lytic murein transglycosylase-like protein
MGWRAGPGGPRWVEDAETTFQDALRRAVAQWQLRLADPTTLAMSAPGIGHEAAALRAAAQSRGLGGFAHSLTNVEQASRQSHQALADAVATLARGLSLADAATAASDGASPGMTVRMSSSPSQPAAPGPRASAPVPRAPLADTIVKPDASPKLFERTMLGLRAFAKKKSPEAPGFPKLPATPQGSQSSPPFRSSAPPPQLFGIAGAGSLGPRPFAAGRSSQSRAPRGGSWPGPAVRRDRVWFYAVGAVAVLLAVATAVVAVALGRRSKDPMADSPADAAIIATSTTLGVRTARDASGPPAVAQVIALDDLSARVHEIGRETPELRALIDVQSRLAAKCRDDPSKCGRGWTSRSREALETADAGFVFPVPAERPLSAWIQRLKIPHDFPLRDEPSMKGVFEFNTKNIAGRQHFQAKLFACGAYADIFDGTLVKYGAPGWLIAVVFQESGCDPLATSPVGARGLWQFMPESARAYGLRVVEDEVDERLNSVKSTDAAIHLLTDLQRKLGEWDLAMAAYNMGPFAVAARMTQVGGKAGFWDLAHAGLLPDETAGYVPAIEAYALILENLGKLQFSRDSKRLESTAEIVVKPGTRLSLVARAAHTSTLRIRELNPEFLRDVIPDGETTARVLDSEAHRAQVFMDSLSGDDNRDTCVPEDFDWGAKVFEMTKYASACRLDSGAAR